MYTMTGNRFKSRLFGRVERLAMAPRVFDRRNDLEVAFGIPHNHYWENRSTNRPQVVFLSWPFSSPLRPLIGGNRQRQLVTHQSPKTYT